MTQITISDLVIEVDRKNIKNIHLGVYPPDGRVRMAVPLKINDEAVRLFAISKLAWIKKHQANFKAQERQPKREFIAGETHYFQGKAYLLNVIYHNGKNEVKTRNNTDLDLYVQEGSDEAQRKKVMMDWYRQQLKKEIPLLIEKWSKIIGVQVNDWGVKQMKTKWGTCNIEAKRIWLNLELAKKTTNCLEYVVVHEMTHLLERHHNERFTMLMNKFLPNWRLYKEELNRSPLESY